MLKYHHHPHKVVEALCTKTLKPHEQTICYNDPHPMNRQKHVYMTATQKSLAFTYIFALKQISKLKDTK